MKLYHICEVCDKSEILTSDEAFDAGWDYPPRMGQFGVVSARTCPNCLIDKTVWWQLMQGNSRLDERQLEVVRRILGEPESIIATGGEECLT